MSSLLRLPGLLPTPGVAPVFLTMTACRSHQDACNQAKPGIDSNNRAGMRGIKFLKSGEIS